MTNFKRFHIFLINVEIFYSWITTIFSKLIFILCPTSTMNFKYLIIWCSNSHLLILTYKSMICNFVKVFHIWFQCSDKKSFVYINTSFKYVETNSFKYFHKIQLIHCWKLFNAFIKSKKIINHLNNLYFVWKAVNHSSFSTIWNL